MDVLKTAIEAAKRETISTIVVASTTGNTASKLLELVKTEKLKTIVVTHDEGRPLEDRRFSEDIRRLLLANNITVYTHNAGGQVRNIVGKILKRLGLSHWQRHLDKVKAEYGTGIKVCHIILKMLTEGKIFLTETKVVAIAGSKSGADSAGIFFISPQNKWPVLEKVIINKV